MNYELKPILSVKNTHLRDGNISFEEKEHRYTINEKGTSTTPYISTTTFIHKHFENFDADSIIKKMMLGKNWTKSKYYGLNIDEIKKIWNDNGSSVSKEGTLLHSNIEKFMNQEIPDTIEYTHQNLLENYMKCSNIILDVKQNNAEDWLLFLKYIKYYPNFVPYRTEWFIYDEEVKIAGSIDMVYLNKDDNTLNIYDWKRSKKITKESYGNKYAITDCINHIPDSNYFHYALQLNIYKAILEKNYNVVVKDLCLVRLHPENKNNSFELIKVINLADEVRDLFEYRKKQLKYENTTSKPDYCIIEENGEKPETSTPKKEEEEEENIGEEKEENYEEY